MRKTFYIYIITIRIHTNIFFCCIENLLLKRTNNELLKKLIWLREEIKISIERNSNLKAEVYNVAMDRKIIMVKFIYICTLHVCSCMVELNL